MMDNVAIDLIVQNDVEWRKHLINMQQKTFDEIANIRKDFTSQKVRCEKRITTIETESKGNARVQGAIFGVISGFIITTITLFGRWILDKLADVIL